MTFDEFRSKISIAEIAEKLGYTQDLGAGKRHLVYYLGDKSSPEEEIIIYPEKNTYFSRKSSIEDKGNLINFVLNRLDRFNTSEKGFRGVNEVLNQYLGSDFHVKYTTSINNSSKPAEIKPFNIQYWKPRSVAPSSIEYLKSRRKLSLQTINDFKSRYHLYTVGTNQHVGFPFRKPGQMEITNFEMRNYFPANNQNFKGFCSGGDKAHSCWIANFVPYEKVTDVYIFESAIDAMSFYEINHFTKETTSALVSTGGHVTQAQITGIQSLFPTVKWHSCTDNDATGNAFDVAIAYYLEGKECKVYANPLPGEIEKTIHISLPGKTEISYSEKLFSSKEYLQENNITGIEIIKPDRGKDWNEQLTYYKRFDLNLSPTAKINEMIDGYISQLNLHGFHSLATSVETNKSSIISLINIPGESYNVSVPLIETNSSIATAYCSINIKNEEIISRVHAFSIYNKATGKTVSAQPILDFLNNKKINILNDFSSDSLKTLIDTKKLTIHGPHEKNFEMSLLSSGWNLKEVFPIKKNTSDTSMGI